MGWRWRHEWVWQDDEGVGEWGRAAARGGAEAGKGGGREDDAREAGEAQEVGGGDQAVIGEKAEGTGRIYGEVEETGWGEKKEEEGRKG